MPIAGNIEAGMLDSSSWWALYTRHQHEKAVAEMLTAKGFEVFLPLYESTRRWKDRRKELDLALFPGYVFVQIALKDKLCVLQLPGAVHLVSFNGQPVALPEAEVETLRDRLCRAPYLEPHPYLKLGRRVRVHSGPLRGVEGIVVRKKDRLRIIVSADLIMRSVSVEVDEADLEPLVKTEKV